jgi:Trypsin-like peptidase domain
MPDQLFQLGGYIFPIFSVTKGKEILHVQQFLGTGFWVDKEGHFLTCKHIFESLEVGQLPAIGQPFGQKTDRFIPILKSDSHPKFDISVGQAPKKTVGGVLKKYEGTFGLGLDVQAFGFTTAGKVVGSYQLDVRLLRGYVTRHSDDSLGLPSPSLIEVSFGSPSGFSGSPLLVDTEVVGVLYRNLESKLESYSVNEVTEGQSQFREVAYRIYEYGIAHRLSDILPFMKQCGVRI